MGVYTITHSSELVKHPVITKLEIKFPSRYETEGRLQSSSTEQLLRNLVTDYTKIIYKLLDNIGSITQEKETGDNRLQLLVTNLGRLNEGMYSDMEFIVGGSSIPAHSAIVSTWSVPIATMLHSTMQEGLTKRIEIQDEDIASVTDMVKYFYSAEVDLHEENALPLLRLSLLYDIPSLRNRCLAYLVLNINVENCIQLFCLAHLHDFEKSYLWEHLLENNTIFIQDHAQDILGSEELCGIELSILTKIWPLVAEHRNELAQEAFLGWARKNWDVDSFPECINYIIAEKANAEQGGQRLKDLQCFYDFCTEAIVSDFEQQSKTLAFKELPASYLRVILARDDLQVSREYVVLEILNSWLSVNFLDRLELISLLIGFVRFPFMSITELLEIPSKFPQITSCIFLSSLLEEAIQFQLQGSTAPSPKKRHSYIPPTFDPREFSSLVVTKLLKLPPPSSPTSPSSPSPPATPLSSASSLSSSMPLFGTPVESPFFPSSFRYTSPSPLTPRCSSPTTPLPLSPS